jgi:hypothetical protein
MVPRTEPMFPLADFRRLFNRSDANSASDILERFRVDDEASRPPRPIDIDGRPTRGSSLG